MNDNINRHNYYLLYTFTTLHIIFIVGVYDAHILYWHGLLSYHLFIITIVCYFIEFYMVSRIEFYINYSQATFLDVCDIIYNGNFKLYTYLINCKVYTTYV